MIAALPGTTVITRPRHPLDGRELRVLGGMRRHGRLELLLVLPDGSKSLIPADWTAVSGQDAGPDGDAGPVATLGRVADLLAASGLALALSARGSARQERLHGSHRARRTAMQPVQLSLLPDLVPAPPPGLLARLPGADVAAAVKMLAGLIAKAAADPARPAGGKAAVDE